MSPRAPFRQPQRWAGTMTALLASITILSGFGPAPSDSLLVSADWLRAHRDEPGLVLLHVGHHMDGAGPVELIPGSVEVDYMDLIRDVGPTQSELPTIDSLRSLLEGRGISNGSRVVIYSADPIMAARAFVTLEAAGHDHLHILNGGTAAWKASHGAVVQRPVPPAGRGRFEPKPRSDVVVDADWVRARLGRPDLALLDTRTVEEFDGTGGRRGIPSSGHLEGAALLLWQDLVTAEGSPFLRALPELRRIYEARGAGSGKTVVAYCYLGYRASLSYFVARLLGYEARFYDGSYDDWSRKGYPLVKAEVRH